MRSAHVQFRLALLLASLASVALAGPPAEETRIRTILLSEHPSEPTQAIYVSGQVATVLRFEQEPVPAKTKLQDWEGRFEPLLVGSKKVVLEPLRDLAEDERASLLVTLADGTEIPFLVSPTRKDGPPTDYQVNVFKNATSDRAKIWELNHLRERERELSEENERLRREASSVDHALAMFLVTGQVGKTAFKRAKLASVKEGAIDIKVDLFKGPDKAAVLLTVTNGRGGQTWRFGEAQVSEDCTSLTGKPFVLRVERQTIAAGKSGRIAVVVDGDAFRSEQGLVDLALQIFRDDGGQQAIVLLEHTLIKE